MRRRRKYDGTFNRRANTFTDAYGQRFYNVHSEELCAGGPCAIHNPSDHHLRKLRLHLRTSTIWDIKPMHAERICEHGVGHPDPDDITFHGDAISVHGCDGCCAPAPNPEDIDDPEKCASCGAAREHLRYEIVDGWCCLSCGRCDSDE